MNKSFNRKKLLGNSSDFLWSYGGYLIVSELCNICGVSLSNNNSRDFVKLSIENLHDILKSNINKKDGKFILNINDEIISKFIDFYTNIGGREYLYNKGDECTNITGGWKEDYLSGYSKTSFTMKHDDYIEMHTNTSPTMAAVETVNKINFLSFLNNGYKRLLFKREVIIPSDRSSTWSSPMIINSYINTYSTFDIVRGLPWDIELTTAPELYSILLSDVVKCCSEGYIADYVSTAGGDDKEIYMKLLSIWFGKEYDMVIRILNQ